MTENEKMLRGEIYDANYDPALLAERKACKSVLFKINHLSPDKDEERYRLFRTMLGSYKESSIFLVDA